jgi:hypothetical protein
MNNSSNVFDEKISKETIPKISVRDLWEKWKLDNTSFMRKKNGGTEKANQRNSEINKNK